MAVIGQMKMELSVITLARVGTASNPFYVLINLMNLQFSLWDLKMPVINFSSEYFKVRCGHGRLLVCARESMVAIALQKSHNCDN